MPSVMTQYSTLAAEAGFVAVFPHETREPVGWKTWPSSELSRSIGEIVGMTTFDIDATKDGWEFMSRFTNPKVTDLSG